MKKRRKGRRKEKKEERKEGALCLLKIGFAYV